MSTIERLISLLKKFANHKSDCRCFICRNLSEDEKAALQAFLSGDGVPAFGFALSETNPVLQDVSADFQIIGVTVAHPFDSKE